MAFFLPIGGKFLPRPNDWQPDGSTGWKMGMYRRVPGTISIAGRRLDAAAPPPQGYYDVDGYGERGFQAGGIGVASQGCWEITASIGETGLTFVVLVVKVAFVPAWPAWLPDGLQPIDWDVSGMPQSVRLVFGSTNIRDGEVSLETAQAPREEPAPYPDDVKQRVIVNGQPAVCVQGSWDDHSK